MLHLSDAGAAACRPASCQGGCCQKAQYIWRLLRQPARKTSKHLLSCLRLSQSMLWISRKPVTTKAATRMLLSRDWGTHQENPPELWRPNNASAGVRPACGSTANILLHPHGTRAAVCRPTGCHCSCRTKAQNIMVPFQATCAQNQLLLSELPHIHTESALTLQQACCTQCGRAHAAFLGVEPAPGRTARSVAPP